MFHKSQYNDTGRPTSFSAAPLTPREDGIENTFSNNLVLVMIKTAFQTTACKYRDRRFIFNHFDSGASIVLPCIVILNCIASNSICFV